MIRLNIIKNNSLITFHMSINENLNSIQQKTSFNKNSNLITGDFKSA